MRSAANKKSDESPDNEQREKNSNEIVSNE